LFLIANENELCNTCTRLYLAMIAFTYPQTFNANEDFRYFHEKINFKLLYI